MIPLFRRAFLASIPLIALATLIFVGATKTAQAYIDPGTGAMIFSAIAGAVVAGLVTIRHFWYRIVTFFRDDKASND